MWGLAAGPRLSVTRVPAHSSSPISEVATHITPLLAGINARMGTRSVAFTAGLVMKLPRW